MVFLSLAPKVGSRFGAAALATIIPLQRSWLIYASVQEIYTPALEAGLDGRLLGDG